MNRDPIEEQGGLNLYCFVKNNTKFSIDLTGLEDVQIVILTVIRPPDAQAGLKTLHRIVVNDFGQIVKTQNFTGTTSVFGLGNPTGTSTFKQSVNGIHPKFTVTAVGNSSSAALPSFLDIDYNYDIELDFCSRKGINDGYPSYVVKVKSLIIWDWQQQNLASLLGSGEIEASAEFTF